MDRTTRGLIAGIVGGVAMNAWNLSDYYWVHITKIRFLDWFAVLLTWAEPTNTLLTVLYLILQTVLWDGFLGIVFTHLIGLITPKGLVFKSTFFSLLVWFIFKVIVNLFRVPVLSGKQPFPGGLSNFLAVILWGVVLGLTLRKLENWAAKNSG
jgi:hypothetical protein